MNFNGLTASYWVEQQERVKALCGKLGSRSPVSVGYVVPDTDDLVIGTGRCLPLTILFTDISGFSSRDSLTPQQQEQNLLVLNLYFTEMIKIVEDYGGTVEKNTGDGLMAYFEDSGEYQLGDNSSKRALACVLTMFAANEYLLSPIFVASGIRPIQFRASLDYGYITVARIGAPQRFNANVAIGNAANFAAKMLSKVGANQVGISHLVRGRLPEDWKSLWCLPTDVETGWVFAGTETPYPLYVFHARWAKLI